MNLASFKSRVGEVMAFVAPNATIKAALPKAAKFIGLGERRLRALHGCEARSIQLLDDEAIFEAEVKISEHFLTEEVERHANRLEYAALRYAAKCPDTHRDRVARCRDLASRVRRLFNREGA